MQANQIIGLNKLFLNWWDKAKAHPLGIHFVLLAG